MIDDDQKQRMAQLEEKLAAAKKAHEEPEPRADEHYSMANQAWRMVTELVAGLVIGLGIGYGLDVLLGTTPIFMVLFILLGLAAGVLTSSRCCFPSSVQSIAALLVNALKSRSGIFQVSFSK